MSLEFFLEASRGLSIAAVESALKSIGIQGATTLSNELEALFKSGLSVSATYSSDQGIHAEDSKGMSFPVALRGYLRIKGPVPDGLSPMDDLDRLITAISEQTASQFLVSFQYESTIYWKDGQKLQRDL